MKVTKCPTKLYQRVIRHRESRDYRDNRETTEKKVIPDFVVVSVVSVVPKKNIN